MLAKYIWFIAFSLNLQYVLMIDSCGKQLTCSDCILDPSGCAWCTLDNMTGSRCKPESSYNEHWCPKSHVQNPINDKQTLINKELSSDHGNVVQIKPQRYKLKLRPGKSMKFDFCFQAAKNYPVDLYFLLDMSNTMKYVKKMTAKKSKTIHQTIQAKTNDVFLGFGTFIDKNVLPMTDKIDSEQTYSFRHLLKLTKEYEDFENIVSNTTSGSNYDDPEGGLDALAQVITCKNIVGWRNESRKIIIFLTDSAYHAAGDARTAGIFQPYDGKCYTNNVSYTKELEMDYPSISMINKLAIENEVIILFVVNYAKYDVYKQLSNSIRGAKVAILSTDDDDEEENIVSILRDTYEEITRKIKLKQSIKMKYGGLKNYQISFDPECSQYNSDVDCDVKAEEEKCFNGIIKLLDYDGTKNPLIDIAVEGISEKLTLDIEVITNCDCERNRAQSEYCNGEIRQCGICKCSDTRYGDTCACKRNTNNLISDNSTCIAEGSIDICSGHGSCVCGTCECMERYEGRYCECSKNNCKRSGGVLCSGTDHGDCVCGMCKCQPDWSGDACECYKSMTNCKGKEDSICNNRGTCVCGACKCYKKTWDERNQESSLCGLIPCPDCHYRQCIYLDKCALCHFNSNRNCTCDGVDTTTIDSLPLEYLNSSTWNLCPNIGIGGGCFTRYVYQYDDVHYRVKLLLQKDKDCAQNYYLYGGICLITLIVIGVLTLVLWKQLTDARDRREYEKFLEQQKHGLSEPCQNDIYVPATTTFMNPTFRNRSFVRK